MNAIKIIRKKIYIYIFFSDPSSETDICKSVV